MTATYAPGDPIWCAGCGHFGAQAALTGALLDLGVAAHETIVLAGIGCSGTVQNNMGTYGYHALHGRVLPTATGVHYANPGLTVIAVGGDGDGYAIGMGHLIHTFRRNPSFTYLVMNNGTYGLTKGQPSPTMAGQAGVLDAVELGLAVGTTSFLARGFARWSDQLRGLTRAALEHSRAGRGLAFLEVVSPCVTYNDTWASLEAELHDIDADERYDPTDRSAAFRVGQELAAKGRRPIGLIYRRDVEPDAGIASHHEIEPAHNRNALAAVMEEYRI